MWVTEQLLVLSNFYSREKILSETLGTRNCLVTHILQSIFFYIQQNKEMYAGLEQPGKIMTEF